MHLQHCIAQRSGEFLLFALTPPRRNASPQRRQEIADVTLERLASLRLDGLILYDIDDESDRNPRERPFPFLPAMDPADYLSRHLAKWALPVVVYRAVGKYTESEFCTWLQTLDSDRMLSVFVGASSGDKDVATTLGRAQALRNQLRPDLMIGGVAIPERHARRGDEHLRLMRKHANGCSFFVTQVVYDVNAAKNLVSDYHDACLAHGTRPAPLVFTFSVCGSVKTLEFLKWLGVDVPRWIQRELVRAGDIAEASYHHAVASAQELVTYCRRLGMPFGVNVESVSIRAAEIAASVRLAEHLGAELAR